MKRAPAVRNLLVAAVAALAGVAIGASLSPTVAAWVDLGGSSMTITSIEEPPPTLGAEPVEPGTDTFFVSAPIWYGGTGVPDPAPKNSCFRVTVSSDSATPVPWTVIMWTGRSPFNNGPSFNGFQGSIYADTSFYNIFNADDYTTSGAILAKANFTSDYVSAGVNYEVKVCAVNHPEPAWQEPGPTTYTQRPDLVLVRSGSQPCVVGTVDGHNRFFVGFTIAFNWKNFLDEQLALSNITSAEYSQWITYTHWAGAAPGYQQGGQGATGTDYYVTFTGYSDLGRNVDDRNPVDLGSCSY